MPTKKCCWDNWLKHVLKFGYSLLQYFLRKVQRRRHSNTQLFSPLSERGLSASIPVHLSLVIRCYSPFSERLNEGDIRFAPFTPPHRHRATYLSHHHRTVPSHFNEHQAAAASSHSACGAERGAKLRQEVRHGKGGLPMQGVVGSIWEFAPKRYLWILLNISGYRWIWKDRKGYLLDFFGQNRISFRDIQEKISTGDIQEISRHIQIYPSHISMSDIHWNLSIKYPRISMLIQIEYPCKISMT